MARDERDLVELLKTELEFIEKGGYGRSVRTPWKETSPFRDSLTCVNYTLPDKAHPCTECHLIDYVPSDRREELVPCHFIPLTESGETVEDFDLAGNQVQREQALKHWMRRKIAELEAERGAENLALDPTE